MLKDPTAVAHENATRALWHLAQTEAVAIPKVGGIVPLVSMLAATNPRTLQHTAAALDSLAKEHVDNQLALAKAGAITPLIALLGSDSADTQEHAASALLAISSHNEKARGTFLRQLVGVLSSRNAAAQMKATEALAVLALRDSASRKAITDAQAIEPLVRQLGDGRRVQRATPQERTAAVLAELARTSENKIAIVACGGVPPLVAMLEAPSIEAQTHAACALWQLAALGKNRPVMVEAGAIPPLVRVLASVSTDAQRFATGALWHLAWAADNKAEMVKAGAIPLLVGVLVSRSLEAREFAAAVVSALARTQGGNKKMIYQAGGVEALVMTLGDGRALTQKHAACALWGLSDGKDGVYDRQIAEAGAIPHLTKLLINGDQET